MSKYIDVLHQEIAVNMADLESGQLQPYRFFVAWHGVITLVFRRFPDSLLTLKTRLNESKLKLPQENEGSRWPKMTLAALAPQKKLSKSDLALLKECCIQHSKTLSLLSPMTVHHLSIVHYTQQSLERYIESRQIALKEALEPNPHPSDLQAEVEKLFANLAVESNDKEQQKILDTSRNVSHYRLSNDGLSLVVEAPCAYQKSINELQKAVHQILPDRYEWFLPKSRHLTVRALR